MSRHSIMKELKLDDFMSAIFSNSQDDLRSPASKSPAQKSQSDQDSIEKPRKALEAIVEEKIISQPEPRNRQDYLTPIDKVTLYSKSSPETHDISTRENTTQKHTLSVPPSRKPTPVSSNLVDVDRGLKFSPAVGKYLSENELSQGSNTQNQMIIEKPKSTEKSRSSGSKSAHKLPQKISETLDEEDYDLMEQYFEEDAKKKSLSEQHESQKDPSENMLTESQEELFKSSQAVWGGKVTEITKDFNPSKSNSPAPKFQIIMNKPDEMPILVRASDYKPIVISQEQLAKASNMFKEDENGDLPAPALKVNHSKLIKVINPENFNKIEKLSQPEELSQRAMKNSQKHSQHSQESMNSQARRLGVKPDSFNRVMKMFEDDDDMELPTPPTISTANLQKKSATPLKAATYQPLPEGLGFFTGFGGNNLKPAHINEDRIAEATKLLEDEDNPIPNTTIKKSTEVRNSQGAVLTTGSQKSKIAINPEKFLQAQKLLADSEDEFPKVATTSMDIEEASKSTKPSPTMISKPSPQPSMLDNMKAKEKVTRTSPFKFTTNATSPNKSTSPSAHSPKNQNTSTTNSQKTSGLTPVISKPTQQILADGYSSFETKTSGILSQRGEGLKVSNPNTMQRVMNIFKEDVAPKSKTQKDELDGMPSFKTGNDKKMNVNADALKKAANFLADDEAEEAYFAKAPSKPSTVKAKINPIVSKKTEQSGFQTAGGKTNIPVNADKFKNFKNMFEDDDDNEGDNFFDEDPETTFGFKPSVNPTTSIQEPAKPNTSSQTETQNPSILINGKKTVAKAQDFGFSKAGGGSKLNPNSEKLTKFLQDFEQYDEDELAEMETFNKPEVQKTDEPAENKQSTPPVLTHSGSFGAPKGKEPSSVESTLSILGAATLQDSMVSTLRLEPATLKLEPDEDNIRLPAEDKNITPNMTPDRVALGDGKQVTKKRLLNDAGKKTVPGKEVLGNNIHGKFSVRPIEEMKTNKPTNNFKFTETESIGSKASMAEEKKDEKNKLKRNYDNFVETSGIQESSIDIIKYLEENPKIKHYKSLLKISKKRTAYNNSYFQLSNFIKKIPKTDEVKDITFQNALDRTFACACLSDQPSSPDENLPCMCDEELIVGWQHLWKYMLKSGFKKDYMTESWFKNHYRLVVWKLASLQRRIKVAGPTKKYNLFNVKNELEYRYYIEHIQGKRSVLQKVLQKDEVASAHMVLLIADIQKEGNKMVIQLTDGWYSVFSEIAIENSYKIEKNNMSNNQLLAYLITSRKLYPGLKIHVANMKVIQPPGKVDPNKEVSVDEKTFVELSYNSISRARWDEKLGVAKSKYFTKSLKSLRNNGGVVSMIDVIVLKKYKQIEKSGNNTTKIFDSMEEGPTDPNRKINFKIRVVDTLLYYTNNPKKYNDTLCEIEIPQQFLFLFDEIRENERIRLYNLKGYQKYDKNNFSFYDHITGKYLNHYLYLQFQKASKCQNLCGIKSTKEEALKIKEFAKINIPSVTFLSSIDHETQEEESMVEYNKAIQSKNEIDIMGIILETDNQKAIGCMSTGHLFKILFHSRPFFPNIKILEKTNSIFLFRNLQAQSMEKIPRDTHFCYNLKTNENTFFTSATSAFKDETNLLTSITKDKARMEGFKVRLDKLLKRHTFTSSGSLDTDQIDKMLEEGGKIKEEAPQSTLELEKLLE